MGYFFAMLFHIPRYVDEIVCGFLLFLLGKGLGVDGQRFRVIFEQVAGIFGLLGHGIISLTVGDVLRPLGIYVPMSTVVAVDPTGSLGLSNRVVLD